jgi:hypothetical protein
MTQTPSKTMPQPIALGTQLPAYDYKQELDWRWDVNNSTRRGACLGLSIGWIALSAQGQKFLDFLEPPKESSSRGRYWKDEAASKNVFDNSFLQDVIGPMKAQGVLVNSYETQVVHVPREQLPEAKNLAYLNIIDSARTNIVKWKNVQLNPEGKVVNLLPKNTTFGIKPTFSPTSGVDVLAIIGEIVSKECDYILLGFNGTFRSASNSSKNKRNAMTVFASRAGHAIAVRLDYPKVILFDPNYGEYLFTSSGAFGKALTDLFENKYAVECDSAYLQCLSLSSKEK